jgi:hypothetical protein
LVKQTLNGQDSEPHRDRDANRTDGKPEQRLARAHRACAQVLAKLRLVIDRHGQCLCEIDAEIDNVVQQPKRFLHGDQGDRQRGHNLVTRTTAIRLIMLRLPACLLFDRATVTV